MKSWMFSRRTWRRLLDTSSLVSRPSSTSRCLTGRDVVGMATATRKTSRPTVMATVMAIAVVIALVSNLADYQLDLALKENYGGDGNGMVRFLALLRLCAGVVAAVLQFFLAGRILERYVPRHLIDRPKMGFGIPLDAWLRGPLRDWAEHLLDEQRLRQQGLLEPAPIRETWAAHLAGKNWSYPLWDVLMLQAWLDANPWRLQD